MHRMGVCGMESSRMDGAQNGKYVAWIKHSLADFQHG